MEKKKSKIQSKLLIGCLFVALLLCTALFTGISAPSVAAAASPSKSAAFDWNKNYAEDSILPYPGTAQSTKIKTTRNTIALGSDCKEFPCSHMVPRVYTSQEDAAKDFGKTYGKWSIRKSREVGSMIYKLGERQFVMSLGAVGAKSSVYPNDGCFGQIYSKPANAVYGDAAIHAHGSEGWLEYKEKLSGPDMSYSAWLSQSVPVPIYVTTPWGDLKRSYGDRTKESYYEGFWFMYFGWIGHSNETVATNMPHDRSSDAQALKFKHWFGKKCNDCAQK